MSTPEQSAPVLPGIRFGAAYYPEYEPGKDIEGDLDLMAAAGFTVIRVGESVWSTWEPRDGEFDLDWLQPTLDGAHARGIAVILGTPTYAIPPWLQVKHPELASDVATGTPKHWGARQEVDYSSPLFWTYCERIIRVILERYAAHPAVIGFQVDNEPGMELFHNAHTFERFVAELAEKYGDVETLNREWGLVYWSHRITDWGQLWVPDGNTLPQYDLAWRAFQARLTTEFISKQADLVREYSAPTQFITTCFQYGRPATHEPQTALALDVTASNPYYGMQDHLAKGVDLPALAEWNTTGPWGLMFQGDRAWASKQARFLVTETDVQTISGSDHNYPPYPGQLKQAALALVARGAAMIEYWHWQSLRYGTETYWGGVLPHSQKPGRIYREVAALGETLRSLGGTLDGFVPDSDIAVLFSHESLWAFNFFPPLHTADHRPDRFAYRRIFDAFYRGVIDAGAQANIVHPEQLGDDPAAFAAAHPVFLVPAFYTATDDQLAFLRDYALAGGHLIAGIRTGYGDDEARARLAVAPAVLSEVAGVWYDEFSNLDAPLAVIPEGGFTVSPEARATAWADGLVVDGATVLAGYQHSELGRFPAITTREVGAGRVTYVGTVPNAALAADIIHWAVPLPTAGEWMIAPTVTVTSGTTGAGRRAWFVHNWSSLPATATSPVAVTDATDGSEFAAGHEFSLEPWAALVLTSE
ncbi:beta-galactosidase [Galbitalea soli]|uniref:beta-galactosidase n=1 Tax=Galbitalea soli TaxID=1268042 RepID=UPI0017D85E7A|nr:beta-galactosidase [Galbitalea soli]